EVRAIVPVSTHTIIRYPLTDSTFPNPQQIGRANYYDVGQIYRWLDSRASQQGYIKAGDTLITQDAICDMLGRSKAWVWLNIMKPKALITVDLSPKRSEARNKRAYFIERQVREVFADLIELVRAA
ncbi:MAG: hypothetical protein KDI15_09920, partial [Thiothrix sp.]|nr:hypothetical protein [Thiothrix sp.]